MNPGCAFGADCTGRDSPLAGNLCDDCRLDTTRDVNALRYDYRDLGQRIPKENRPSDVQIRRKKPGPSEPADLHVMTLRDDIVNLALYWAGVLVQRGNLPTRSLGHSPAAITWAVHLLAPRVDEVAGIGRGWGDVWPGAAKPWPGDERGIGTVGLLRLRAYHRQARKILALTAGKIGLPGECPDRTCRARGLYRMDGSEIVSCGACDRRWRYEDYQRYVSLKVTRIPIVDSHPNE